MSLDAPLHQELVEYQQQFRANQDRAARLCAALDHEQFNWEPEAGSWSVAQCLMHLTQTNRLYLEKTRPAIERGRERQVVDPGPFRYDFLSRWFRSFLEEPKRRVKTPAMFRPAMASNQDVVTTLHGFRDTAIAWNQCIENANGLNLRKVKVTSPATRLLRFPLGAIFGIMIAHEQRHLQQAENVTHAEGFPDR